MVRARESASARRTIAPVPLSPGTAVPALVVVQKDLLQGGRAALERYHGLAGELRYQRPDVARHLEAQRVGTRLGDLDAGERRELGHRAVEADLDRLHAQVAQVGERSLVDEPPLAQDPDAVADRLDLAEDVRREEDRLAPISRLSDGLAKRHLHQRVEAARR